MKNVADTMDQDDAEEMMEEDAVLNRTCLRLHLETFFLHKTLYSFIKVFENIIDHQPFSLSMGFQDRCRESQRVLIEATSVFNAVDSHINVHELTALDLTNLSTTIYTLYMECQKLSDELISSYKFVKAFGSPNVVIASLQLSLEELMLSLDEIIQMIEIEVEFHPNIRSSYVDKNETFIKDNSDFQDSFSDLKKRAMSNADSRMQIETKEQLIPYANIIYFVNRLYNVSDIIGYDKFIALSTVKPEYFALMLTELFGDPNGLALLVYLNQEIDLELDYHATMVELYFYKNYSFVKDLQREVLFLQNWNKILDAVITQPQFKTTNVTFRYVMNVHALLYDNKSQYYKDFYTNQKSEHLANYVLYSRLLQALNFEKEDEINDAIVVKKIHDELFEEKQQLVDQVSEKEKNLKQYNRVEEIPSVIARLWSRSYYHLSSKLYFTAVEEFTQISLLKDKALLTTQLTSVDLFAISHIGAAMYLGVDLFSSKWLGVSFPMIRSLSEQLFSNYGGMVNAAKRLHLSERKTIQYYIPLLRFMVDMNIYVGSNLLRSYIFSNEISKPMFVFQYVSYAISMLFQKGMSVFVEDTIHDNFDSKLDKSAQYLFLSQFVTHAGFMLGTTASRFLYPFCEMLFYTPSNQEILSNQSLCLKYSERCQDLVLNNLGLNQEDDHSSIRKMVANNFNRDAPESRNFVSNSADTNTVHRDFQLLKSLYSHNKLKLNDSDPLFKQPPLKPVHH